MNDPANDPTTQEKAFAELREALGWYEHVPVIEEMHPLAATNEVVIVCCHDTANDNSKTVPIQFEQGHLGEIVTDEAQVTDEAKVRIAHHLAAAYN